jgi:hypothetical protein
VVAPRQQENVGEDEEAIYGSGGREDRAGDVVDS